MSVETGDVKASIAVLSFIISNATRFGVDGESLSSELQQLGFPKGNDDHHLFCRQQSGIVAHSKTAKVSFFPRRTVLN